MKPSSTGVVKDAAQEALSKDLSEDLATFLANPSLKAALADGSLDLTSYSQIVESELEELEAQCILKYRQQSGEIQALEDSIQESVTVLNKLHEMLLGFQADVGGLSHELRQLQEKSRTIDVQLRNRRAAEEGLRRFCEKICLAPSLAHTILADYDSSSHKQPSNSHNTINLTFCKAVQEVHQLYQNATSAQPQDWACNHVPSETLAGNEMKERLAELQSLAVVRIRHYFITELSKFSNIQTNFRMVQIHSFLKVASLYDFVEDVEPAVAAEILNKYIDRMSTLLAQLFRTYFFQLQQLDFTKHTATRQDVIAIDDASLRDSLTTKAKKRTDILSLQDRLKDCFSTDNVPIVAHHSKDKQFHFEQLYRSVLHHLVNVVTNEHVFCRQFFKRDLYQPLFSSTLSSILDQVESYLFSCHDAISILLMIKITHHYKRLTRSRKIHSMDPFFDQITKLFWPRLRTVIEAHNRSLTSATAVKLGGVDLHAHYVTRRFAEFMCSMLLMLYEGNMNKASSADSVKSPSQQPSRDQKITPRKLDGEAFSSLGAVASPTPQSERRGGKSLPNDSAGDRLMEDLEELSQNYLLLLERLAEEHRTQKTKIVFLINNVDYAVTVFQERRVVGKEFNLFLKNLLKYRESFVEEELLTSFSKLIAFVQQTEAHITSTPKGPYDVNPQVVESLVLEFASNWKSAIEQINRDVLSYFSNFRNGMEILKQVLTQLLLYYTRFQDIIRKVWKGKPPAFAKDIVGTTIILSEIKKYALSM